MPNYVVNGVQVDPLVLAIPSSAFLIFLSKLFVFPITTNQFDFALMHETVS